MRWGERVCKVQRTASRLSAVQDGASGTQSSAEQVSHLTVSRRASGLTERQPLRTMATGPIFWGRLRQASAWGLLLKLFTRCRAPAALDTALGLPSAGAGAASAAAVVPWSPGAGRAGAPPPGGAAPPSAAVRAPGPGSVPLTQANQLAAVSTASKAAVSTARSGSPAPSKGGAGAQLERDMTASDGATGSDLAKRACQ